MSTTLRTAIEVTDRWVDAEDERSELERILADARLLKKFHETITSFNLPTTVTRPFTIGVTAAVYDEGATSVALGIAASLACDNPTRVAIADCDLGWPSLHRRLNVPVAPGLGEIIAQRATKDEALRQTLLPNLRALSAGQRPQRGVLAALALRGWLTQFLQQAETDYLVLDLPPVNVDLGTHILAALADAVILVVRAGATPRKEVQAALNRLEPTRLAGIVVNEAQPGIPDWLSNALATLSGE